MTLTLAAIRPVAALDPNRQISQYGHTAWRLADGVFAGAPHAMTQTTDGYTWIGTETGLVRFDGVRFVPWAAPAGTALPASNVQSLLGARDGSLWIGTGAGLARWNNRQLTNYPLTAGRINAIVEDADGVIWMVRSRPQNTQGALCSVSSGTAQCFNLHVPYAEALAVDPAGGLWIGTTAGVCHWTRGAVDHYFPGKLKHAEGANGVEALATVKDGSLLVGIGQSGAGLGLQRLTKGKWTDALNGPSVAVVALLMDRNQGTWIATRAAGLVHVYQGRIATFSQSDGLSGDAVESFFEDREGNVWTMSPRGIDRFRDLPVGTITKREGLATDGVNSVFASPSGTLWIANRKALGALRQSLVMSPVQGNTATSLLEDRAGNLWVGIDGGLMVKGYRHPVGMTIGMAEDIDGIVWALVTGKPQKLLRFNDYKIVDEVPLPDAAIGGALAADPGGGIWVGHRNGTLERYRAGQFESKSTGQGVIRHVIVGTGSEVWAASTKGLVHWKDGSRETLTRANGLPCDDLYSVIQDLTGKLWVSGTCGLIAISQGKVARWFDVFDGAQPGTTPFAPPAARTLDGRLWFATESGLQFIDPARYTGNSLPPPIQIEQIVADGVGYLQPDQVRLPASTRNIQIDYTALSFAVPQKVQFRYRLDNFDEHWQDAQKRRQAFYTDLAPGNYRFRVMACNNDGVWNQAEATWDFTIAAHFYHTWWFRLMMASVAALMLWAAYELRIRQVAADVNARFDERLAERNRVSSELQDAFLQSVQASRMMADLALQSEGSDLRPAMVTLAEWLTKATAEGQAALNSLGNSIAHRNDLAEALRRAAESFCSNSAMELNLTVDGISRPMHPIIRDEIFRIGTEAIRNACNHSGGKVLHVTLRYGRNLTMLVRDDGHGFDLAATIGGGLEGMRQAARSIRGRLRLTSTAKAGTAIELVVPGKIAFYAKGKS